MWLSLWMWQNFLACKNFELKIIVNYFLMDIGCSFWYISKIDGRRILWLTARKNVGDDDISFPLQSQNQHTKVTNMWDRITIWILWYEINVSLTMIWLINYNWSMLKQLCPVAWLLFDVFRKTFASMSLCISPAFLVPSVKHFEDYDKPNYFQW